MKKIDILNTSFRTISGTATEVKSEISQDLFNVSWGGKDKMMRLYEGKCPEFIKEMMGVFAPYGGMLWPLDIIESETFFGIISDSVPKGYVALDSFMGDSPCGFASEDAKLEACLQLVAAFGILNKKGYCFHCATSESFYINPISGDVILGNPICIGRLGASPSFNEISKYVAPEIMRGESLPSATTDLHTLAVVLFVLLISSHPLEGKMYADKADSAFLEYASNPIFVFDRMDDRNNTGEKNAEKEWRLILPALKECFVKTFSRDAMLGRGERASIVEFAIVLTTMKSGVLTCVCGNREKSDGDSLYCSKCGKVDDVMLKLKLDIGEIPVYKGGRVYKCQITECTAEDALEPVFYAVIRNNDTKVVGFMNMTSQILSAITPSGIHKKVASGEVIPFNKGITVQVYGKTLRF